MRYLFFILLLNFTFITKGQEVIDSSQTVMLEVQVFDEDSITPLDSVKISVIGTDLSQKTYFTDNHGFIAIELKLEIAYVIIARKYNYLIGKNKFATKENLDKRKYSLQFYLEKIKTLGCFASPIYRFSENNYERTYENSESNNLSVIYDIMIENPTIVLEFIAFKSKNEPENISKKRVQKIINELVAQGIEKDRLVFKDGGIGENEKEEDNRYVVFRIIKTDYVSKDSKKMKLVS